MKLNPKGYYIHTGGGLGDVMMDYSTGKAGWGYLKALKERWPRTHTKVMLTSTNAQAKEFVRHNPHIDRIEQYNWQNPHKPWLQLEEKAAGYTSLAAFGESLKGTQNELKFTTQPIYTSPQDNQVVGDIVKQGKYILIHPFAGSRERITLTPEDYYTVVDRLVDELSLNVVVVGGTYRQITPQATLVEETFDYERSGLFNLVNKTNARVIFCLAQKCVGFIGTWSCYLYPVLLSNIRAVVMWSASVNIPSHPCYRPHDPINKRILVGEDRPTAITEAIQHLKDI
jgi:ADP-heptose:LPS heptosyltransferase